MYNSLEDEELICCYYKAVRMRLDQDFIDLLHEEIKKRKLEIEPAELLSPEMDRVAVSGAK